MLLLVHRASQHLGCLHARRSAQPCSPIARFHVRPRKLHTAPTTYTAPPSRKPDASCLLTGTRHARTHPSMLMRATSDSPQQLDEGDEQLTPSQRALEDFLVWLVANGVEGIGLEDSKVALFEGVDGERGLMALEPIVEGEVVLRVPLKLALTDYAEDEESNRLMYEGAPWSVRLAGKLLREAAKGRSSAWYPYIQVLPARVPCPLEAFSWEELQDIEWEPTKCEIYEVSELVADAYQRASTHLQVPPSTSSGPDDAADGAPASQPDPRLPLGGASPEAFSWACSVVHSRTFANAARTGGVGVRMLVPLVDMINHAGDTTESASMDDPRIVPTDNVRWDLVPPQGPSGGWVMAVKATQAVQPGQQIAFSYGDRSSDDFFVHYGFVPPLCNPHEDAAIFENLEEALDWHYEEYGKQVLSGEQAFAVYSKVLEQCKQQQWEQVAQMLRPALPSSGEASEPSLEQGAGALLPGWQKLRVHAGGRVDGVLASAFDAAAAAVTSAPSTSDNAGSADNSSSSSSSSVSSSDAAVAGRCWQLLQGMRYSLLHDLWLLREDARVQGESTVRLDHLTLEQVERERLVANSNLWRPQSESADSQSSTSMGVSVYSSREASSSSSRMDDDSSRRDSIGSSSAGIGSSWSDITQEVLMSVGRSVAAGCEGGLPDLPLTGNAQLICSFRAAKKEVLWGVCGKAALAVAGASGGGGGRESGGSERSDGGGGLETLVLPARNSLGQRGGQ